MERPGDFDPSNIATAHRVMGAVVGFAFASAGVILIGWLWLQPFGFMHPPLIFRLMGSVVAIIFVAVGSAAGIASLRGHAVRPPKGGFSTKSAGDRPVGYRCPACGAGLGEGAEVSPAGDVKCAYCRTWFNVHQ